MKKLFFSASLVAALMGVASMQSCSDSSTTDTIITEGGDVYTFDLLDEVSREHVTFKNRYGITLAADLYLPKTLDKNAKNYAVVIGAPYGGVKEQAAGLYAMELAKRGCIAVAFDLSYNGASAGTPRFTGSSEIFAEDYSAAVDFLGSLSYVDREKIGALGVGSSAGFALRAAKVDKRLKAIISVGLIDLDRISRFGFLDGEAAEEVRSLKLIKLAQQRWADVDSGRVATTEAIEAPLDSVPAGYNPFVADLYSYYGTKRGWHPRAKACFTKNSIASFMSSTLYQNTTEFAPASLLFIVGGNDLARYMSDGIFNTCSEPKALYVVPNATHCDLYDKIETLPLNDMNGFFKGMQ